MPASYDTTSRHFDEASLGKVSWCPDEYFGITEAGRQLLREPIKC